MNAGVPCILCQGTDSERECREGQCQAQQLDLTDHPVEVLKDLHARLGFAPMSAEAEADARALCDQVPPQYLPALAATVRQATKDWERGW